MSDEMIMPNVVTTLRVKERNFIFHVVAYRRLNVREARQCLGCWLHQSKRRSIPKNMEVTYQTIIGFDE